MKTASNICDIIVSKYTNKLTRITNIIYNWAGGRNVWFIYINNGVVLGSDKIDIDTDKITLKQKCAAESSIQETKRFNDRIRIKDMLQEYGGYCAWQRRTRKEKDWFFKQKI